MLFIRSDETKMNRFGSEGNSEFEKDKIQILHNHVQGTFKHGGGRLLLWGCITSLGIGEACMNDEIDIYSGVKKECDLKG